MYKKVVDKKSISSTDTAYWTKPTWSSWTVKQLKFNHNVPVTEPLTAWPYFDIILILLEFQDIFQKNNTNIINHT